MPELGLKLGKGTANLPNPITIHAYPGKRNVSFTFLLKISLKSFSFISGEAGRNDGLIILGCRINHEITNNVSAV